MGEREPNKEIIGRGELFHLCHPGTAETFSGYGLTLQPGSKDLLVGLLMIDRPRPADPAWLRQVESTFGGTQLVPMTATGERGIACQLHIETESLVHLRRFPSRKTAAIKSALHPLLEEPPNPVFTLRWNEPTQLWESQIASPNQLPGEIRDVFEKVGYGCLATETDIGVVHICHAADADIENFANKPVRCQWQLVQMPTAPLIRLDVKILDHPTNPYMFESFLNVAAEDQARVLDQLANQDQLYLAFYGDGLDYRFTKIIQHDRQHWQCLDEMVDWACRYWDTIPPEQRDFDRAKDEFMRRYP